VLTFLQNLYITKNGLLLVNQHFGNCFSLGSDQDLVSGFFWALEHMSVEIAGSSLRAINFDNVSFHFHHDLEELSIKYILITDLSDDPNEIKEKIIQIAYLFNELHAEDIKNFKGDTTPFQKFGNALLRKKVVDKICGNFLDCKECPKYNFNSEVLGLFRKGKTNMIKEWFDKGKDNKLKDEMLIQN
jgi:hypothetical protein